MSATGNSRPQRQNSESLEFTVKGPVAVSLDEDEVTSPGCSVGELVFRNYYTAWLTVLIRIDISNKTVSRGSSQAKIFGPSCKGSGSGTKHIDQGGGWMLSVPRRVLMTNPHLENGSHDIVSIPSTESQVEWKNIITVRLVLRQPSPIWRTFHVEELNVYRDLPHRIPRPIQHSPPTAELLQCQQYDTLLTLVRHQTLAALTWIPEPKDSASVTDNTGPCGYEFFNLPQI
ncbi:hypothetical protein C0J52_19316 [Blattella germanica]|nr:hypothetical protein C0J52_19316 [Blattella germanica]